MQCGRFGVLKFSVDAVTVNENIFLFRHLNAYFKEYLTGLDETDSLPDAKGIRAKNIKSGHKIFVESSERLRASVEEEIVLAPPPCIHNSVIVMASLPGTSSLFTTLMYIEEFGK